MSKFIIPEHIDIEDTLGGIASDVDKARTLLNSVLPYFDHPQSADHPSERKISAIEIDFNKIFMFLDIADDMMLHIKDRIEPIEAANRIIS